MRHVLKLNDLSKYKTLKYKDVSSTKKVYMNLNRHKHGTKLIRILLLKEREKL